MTTNNPEIIAYRHPSGYLVDSTTHPEHYDALVLLSEYETLQAELDKLRKHLQNLIDQTTPLEPEPGNPMWSRRIQLGEVLAERDQLRAKCEKLRACLAETAGVAATMLYESHKADTLKEFPIEQLSQMVGAIKHLADANIPVEKVTARHGTWLMDATGLIWKEPGHDNQ